MITPVYKLTIIHCKQNYTVSTAYTVFRMMWLILCLYFCRGLDNKCTIYPLSHEEIDISSKKKPVATHTSYLSCCTFTSSDQQVNYMRHNERKLDPVVQSIVSLTISLRHKFVKQISAKVTNTLLFFVEKM